MKVASHKDKIRRNYNLWIFLFFGICLLALGSMLSHSIFLFIFSLILLLICTPMLIKTKKAYYQSIRDSLKNVISENNKSS